MIGGTAYHLTGLASIGALQTNTVIARTKAALRICAALFVAIVATLALALVLGTTAHAATITVDSLADTGASGICVLRDAINAANTRTAINGCAAGDGNDTIEFSITGTIFLASTLPQITDSNLTINGPALPRVKITGLKKVQVMVVAAGATLNLNNLKIANGLTPGFGAGISNAGTLSVTNGTFSGDDTGSGGGGIYNSGTLTVTRSTFSGNRDVNGGGIDNVGTMTVTNSTFSGNNVSAGGGISNSSLSLNVVTNSTFSDNHVGRSGGGIFNSGMLSVTNSTFSSNGALKGGGIFNSGTLTLTNCTIFRNSSRNMGGGIFNSGSLAITNSTFARNNSRLAGGGIFNDSSSGVTNLKSTILAAAGRNGGDCATGQGGGIFDLGYNIADDATCGFSATGSSNSTDPMLDGRGLRNNGGPTQTIAEVAGSPAIDAIPVADCTDQASPPKPVITDQRLFPRPDAREAVCDIGAYEFRDTP